MNSRDRELMKYLLFLIFNIAERRKTLWLGKSRNILSVIFLDKYLEIRGLRPGFPLRTNKAVFPAGAAVHSSTCFGKERLEELFENVFVCSKNDSFKNLVSP